MPVSIDLRVRVRLGILFCQTVAPLSRRRIFELVA